MARKVQETSCQFMAE